MNIEIYRGVDSFEIMNNDTDEYFVMNYRQIIKSAIRCGFAVDYTICNDEVHVVIEEQLGGYHSYIDGKYHDQGTCRKLVNFKSWLNHGLDNAHYYAIAENHILECQKIA